MKSMKILSLLLCIAILCSLLTGCGAGKPAAEESAPAKSDEPAPAAQDGAALTYPDKPIKIIVPWGVGGGTDTLVRKIAEIGEKYIGGSIIVENHNGASGTIAMEDCFAADSDGYTIVTGNSVLFSLTPHFIDVTYSMDDFTMLKGIRRVKLMFVAGANSGYTSFADIIEYGKDHTVKFATTSGVGGDQFTVAMAAFLALGIQAEAVPYGSAAESINAAVNGEVDLGLCTPTDYFAYAEDGSAVAIATFFPEDLDTPYGTIETISNYCDVEFTGVDDFCVRSDVPDEIKQIISDMLDKVYADPEFVEWAESMNIEVWGINADELTAFVANDMNNMAEYIALLEQAGLC